MSPPIYTPDGNEVSEVILPDGTSASEVRDPDGNVVFSGIPDSGISRWTFDDADTDSGTAIDSWGTNDGTINGATTGVSGIAGYDSGEAYDFDGTNDYVAFGDVYDLTGGYSISVWAKFDDVSNNRTVYSASPTDGFQTLIRANSGSVSYFHNNTGTENEIARSSITTGTSYHFVITWDGSSAVAYLDGNSVGSISASDVENPATNHNAGRRWDTDEDYMDGVVDDPRVYNKALSSTEVSSLYNTGSISG